MTLPAYALVVALCAVAAVVAAVALLPNSFAPFVTGIGAAAALYLVGRRRDRAPR